MSDPAKGGDIAIIGMAGIFPGAKDVQQYWENILNKVDAISDPPPEWEADRYYDPSSEANDRTYCRRGGYLGELAELRPAEFGVMPNAIDGSSPDHFLALRVAYEALADAGYADPAKLKTVRQRTAVILGHGEYINRGHSAVLQHGILMDAVLDLVNRMQPGRTESELAELKKTLKSSLPPFHPDSVPGLVPNVISGRIANRLDLMGPSYVVDGACASSLLAVDGAVRELLLGRCDMVLAGGVNCSITPATLIIFSQLKGLSRKGQIRSFDKDADGTLMGEGVGMMVLKRREDAERDGDRIYAILKGLGIASDGRALGLLAPRLEGEELAIRRAYEATGIDPSTVELVEGHGTATVVGDATELEALSSVFGRRAGDLPRCALGSVKSMIGHSIPASGMASLIKIALSLYHKVLPPTINFDNPNPKLEPETSNIYLNTETRPWIHGSRNAPRRAGVNAFGFGGINAHAILEEYTAQSPATAFHRSWDSELFVVSGTGRTELMQEARRLRDLAAGLGPTVPLKDLAWTQNCVRPLQTMRLSVVAKSHDDLIDKLDRAAAKLEDQRTERIRDNEGVYWFQRPLTQEGKLAFVFPGEGAQYLNMMADLCLHFPEVRQMFDLMDRTFEDHPRGYLPSEVIVPPPTSTGRERLFSMDVGAEAVFCANQAIFALLDRLEIRADAMVGHSTGEHSALACSGVAQIGDDAELARLILTVNGVFEGLKTANGIPERALLAIGGAPRPLLESMTAGREDVYIALDNCPNQVVLCGTDEAIDGILKRLEGSAAICQKLPFARAYHTPWFESFADRLRDYFNTVRIGAPKVPLYSCVTADRFPADPAQVREIGAIGWARTVRFRETIEHMYQDGMRIFVEVGPRGNLRSFIDDILRGKRYTAIPSNVQHRSGILQLHHLLGQLVAHGVPARLEHLYEYRAPRPAEKPQARKPAMRVPMGMQPMRLPPDYKVTEKAAPAPVVEPVSPPAAVASPVAPLTGRAAVMQQHFATMAQFLAVQQQVMSSMFQPGSVLQPAAAPEEPSGKLPFISEVLELTPGVRARAICRFRQEPLFEHHALGRDVSEEDPTLVGLPIVPLTVSVEVLAEGAALLEPGKVVVSMRNMRSQRWIMLDDSPPVVELTAERIEPGVVDVKMRELETGRPIRPLWMEATVLFDSQYPPAEPPLPFHLDNPKKSKWIPKSLYPWGMFHGPLLRGIISVDQTAVNGASATMEILRHDALFVDDKHPRFVLDPVTLDVVGQLTSFWSQEQLDPVCDFFPYTFETLKCFSAMPPVGTRLEGRIIVHQIAEKMVRCSLEVLDLAGRVLYRIENWEDRRFPQWIDLWAFRISPRDGFLSRPSDELIAPFAARGPLSCCRLDRFPPGYLEASFGIWQKMLALLVLSRREREFWYGLKTDKRRSDWLIGRCAAKDAVRTLVKKVTGRALFPADIEIMPDASGRPMVEGGWTQRLGVKPVVTLAHSEGVAVALAALDQEHLVGIDLECLARHDEDIEALAFTEEERRMLAEFSGEDHAEWVLRLWCAKEAAGKALGRGLSRGLHSLAATQIEPQSGTVHIGVRDGMLKEFPQFAGMHLPVYTCREKDFVFSTIVCPPGSEA